MPPLRVAYQLSSLCAASSPHLRALRCGYHRPLFRVILHDVWLLWLLDGVVDSRWPSHWPPEVRNLRRRLFNMFLATLRRALLGKCRWESLRIARRSSDVRAGASSCGISTLSIAEGPLDVRSRFHGFSASRSMRWPKLTRDTASTAYPDGPRTLRLHRLPVWRPSSRNLPLTHFPILLQPQNLHNGTGDKLHLLNTGHNLNIPRARAALARRRKRRSRGHQSRQLFRVRSADLRHLQAGRRAGPAQSCLHSKPDHQSAGSLGC
jgi:hypothetical protein